MGDFFGGFVSSGTTQVPRGGCHFSYKKVGVQSLGEASKDDTKVLPKLAYGRLWAFFKIKGTIEGI